MATQSAATATTASGENPIRKKIGSVAALWTAQPMTGAAPMASAPRQQMTGQRIAQKTPKRGRQQRAESSIDGRCHGASGASFPAMCIQRGDAVNVGGSGKYLGRD